MSLLPGGLRRRCFLGGRSFAGARPEPLSLKRLDVLPTVEAPTAYFQVWRPLSAPAPSFKGSLADAPAGGELFLSDMMIVVHGGGLPAAALG